MSDCMISEEINYREPTIYGIAYTLKLIAFKAAGGKELTLKIVLTLCIDSTMDDFIPTRVSRIKEDAAKEFVSVCYERPKKRRTEAAIESTPNFDKLHLKFDGERAKQNEDFDERKKQELEMKRVRYEIMKFGMSGLKGVKAEKEHVALALSLGAKPPKRESINYKLLQHKKKVSKEMQQKRLKHGSGLERSLSNRKTKKARKKNSDSILGVYGKVSKKLSAKSKK